MPKKTTKQKKNSDRQTLHDTIYQWLDDNKGLIVNEMREAAREAVRKFVNGDFLKTGEQEEPLSGS